MRPEVRRLPDPQPTQTVQVELGTRSYPIHIGPGVRHLLDKLGLSHTQARRIVIVVDDHVAKLHLGALLVEFDPAPLVLKVPPGEGSKSLALASHLYNALADAQIERRDLIVTFGGGVVGDLGGFVAATWLRGIDFVQVPTTLEAAVDASVGGKTGLNHPAGKNLIGAFHQPVAVILDTDFLATLPQRDFVSGLGESVKHAVIRDPALFAWHETQADAILARQPDVLVELIARNCQIKADIVGRDEREQNLRAMLNYGHTVGHAVEHLLGYELRHGECVALGMIAANELACARGRLDRRTADRIVALLARLDLPTHLPKPVDPQAIARSCRSDKKVTAGAVNFVLAAALGQTTRVADVTDAEIAAAAETLQP